jgi:hypothetical protein
VWSTEIFVKTGGVTMKELRRCGEGELIVHRTYTRSRHERQFAAAAYEIVVARLKRELFAELAQAGERIRAPGPNPDNRARRPA